MFLLRACGKIPEVILDRLPIDYHAAKGEELAQRAGSDHCVSNPAFQSLEPVLNLSVIPACTIGYSNRLECSFAATPS
jgi:hypothetical protein